MTTRSPARAHTKHMIPNENKSAERLSPPSFATPSYTRPVTDHSSESVQISSQMIQQRRLSPDHSSPSNVEVPCLVDTQSISIEPPITKSTLSQLDADQLYGNLLLRQDLNFDPNIQYRPVTGGDLGNLRTMEASEYWDALSLELARWFMRRDNAWACTPRGCRCASIGRSLDKNKHAPRTRLIRLPRMIDTVRQILKGLLPEEEWPTIDRRLDISLLVQQLDNDAADFVNLSDWLGSLLRKFCSPERHHMITSMTSTIRLGVYNRDVGRLSNGLMHVFEILEVMKLVCYHHISSEEIH